MAYRAMGRGSYLIQMSFKGVGRIRRASGTRSQKTFAKIVLMLQQLYENGKHDILREIRDGVMSPMEVYGLWTTGDLSVVPTVTQLRPIVPTIPDWVEKEHDASQITKKGYGGAIRTFAKHVGDTEPIRALPELLERYKQQCRRNDHPRMFNLVRAVIQAFLKATEGRNSFIYGAVANVEALAQARKKAGKRLTVREADKLLKKLEPPMSEMVRGMLLTGMNPKEYWDDGFEVLSDRILIHGRKRAGRERFVPLVQAVDGPRLGKRLFGKQLAAAHPGVVPLDLRRTYAHWMEEAAIPRAHRMMYMGHGHRDVTDLYERVDIEGFLKDDAKRLRTYISAQRGKQPSTPSKLADTFFKYDKGQERHKAPPKVL